MSSFFKSLVERILPGKAAGAPELHLAVFGKHPGWNDHIDDIGMDTERLIAVKRLLYVAGIGANIDAGAWDKLDDDQRLEKFHHLFVWYTPGELVVGRFWSSTDGKGRAKYPMAVCVQTVGIATQWTLARALSYLEKTQERCVAAPTAEAVNAVVESDRTALREMAQEVAGVETNWSVAPRAVAELAEKIGCGVEDHDFFRILYQIERGMGAYRPGAAKNSPRRTEQMRVPRGPVPPAEAAGLWLRILLSQLDPATPILLLVPVDEAFIDVIVGEPSAAQMFCVRASPKSVPLTTDIPYTLDEQFITAAHQFIAACKDTSAAEMPLAPRM